MPVPALLFLIASALYAGFQWTIRVVVYPQFAEVGAAKFAGYERSHQRRVSLAVGPLFAALGGTAIACVIDPPHAARGLAVLGAALVLAVLGVTAFLAVPQHRILDAGWNAPAHRRLLRVDTARLVLALASVVVAVVLLVQG